MSETAYRTADPAVLAEYEKWKAGTLAVNEKRAALTDDVGRRAYINRGNGFASTRVVGFERLDSDKDGETLHHGGCLIVSSKRGQHNGLVVPNLRRKAGKEFDKELRTTYTTPNLILAGMPTFHVYSSPMGLVAGRPGVFCWGEAVYAFWSCDDAPVQDNWEQIPLSTYHLAKEQYDAEQE